MNKLQKLLVLGCTFSAFSSCQAASTNFISISDIHLNPFDKSSHYPVIDSNNSHNDTNMFYLQRFIGSMAYQTTHASHDKMLDKKDLPAFIVISGDLLAHDFATKVADNKDGTLCSKEVGTCALSTIDKIVNTIRTTQDSIFRNTPIYIALGNNDFDTGDYKINLQFLPKLGSKIYDYAHPNNGIPEDKVAFENAFANNGGAYSINNVANQPQLNLLALDTVLYANKKTSSGKNILECKQDQKTVDCKNVRVAQNNFIEQYESNNKNNATTLAVMHIPPYSSDFGYDNNAKPTLDNNFTNNAYTLSGHWHMYANLHQVNGLAQNSVTFRKGVKPGFLLMNASDGKIKEQKHCTIDNPEILSGSKIDLPFTCH